MMNIRTRWALVIGLTLATISTTMLLSNNVPVVVKDGNGVSQTFMVVQNAAGGLVAENAICDGQAAAACATVKGSSSAAAATDSAMVVALTPNSPAVTSPQAATFSWPPGTAPVTGVGTFTESPTAGSNFVAPVAIGSAPTLTTSATAGPNNVQVNGVTVTVTTSGAAGTNFVAPIAIGLATVSAQANTLVPTGIVGISSTVAVSPASTTLVQTGYPADAACTSDTATCSEIALLKRIAQDIAGSIAAGTNTIGNVGLAAQTTGGCVGQTVTASTSSIFTQIKGSAGTLCWFRIINASAVTASVRLYDNATAGNLVCSQNAGGTPTTQMPASFDIAQPNTVSPGLVANIGPYGLNFSNGIGLCITGNAQGTLSNTGSLSTTDTTSLTTADIVVNLGFK